jgi:hypothetical protein
MSCTRNRTASGCAVGLALFSMAVSLALPGQAQGQASGRSTDGGFGLELQAYPAGLIAVGHYRFALSDKSAFGLHVGANLTDRQDFGEHDNESGSGYGAGVSYRRALSDDGNGWFVGGRLDVWLLEIDWQDAREGLVARGETDVTVLQPSAQIGYRWPSGFDLSLGLGVEINLETDGEEVGEGAIGLLGVGYSF